MVTKQPFNQSRLGRRMFAPLTASPAMERSNAKDRGIEPQGRGR